MTRRRRRCSRRQLLAAGLSAGTLSIAGCGGGDAEPTGTATALAPPELTRDWMRRAENDFSRLSYHDGSLYVATGHVYGDDGEPPKEASAFALAPDGEVRWQTALADGLSDPLVRDGTLYVTDTAGHVNALSTAEGEVDWRHDYTDLFEGVGEDGEFGTAVEAPVLLDGQVLVRLSMHDEDPRLLALDAETGEHRWGLTGYGWSTRASADGALLRSGRGILEAWEPDGGRRWAVRFDGNVTTVQVERGVVYATSADDTLRAIDAATGEERWQVEARNDLRQPPLIEDDAIYVAGRDYFLRRIGHDGTERWRTELDGRGVGPARVGDTLVVGVGRRGLGGYDPADGTERWQVDRAPKRPDSGASVGGVWQLVAGDGGVYARYGSWWVQRLEVDG